MKIKIDNLGMNFEGVARLNNKVCFVDKALLGEEVEVSVYEDKKNFSRAKVDQILTKSAERVVPVCPYFDICGGCDIQHMNYASQLYYKKKNLKETIKKIANIDVEINDVEGSPNPYFYRNKGAFPISEKVGMFKEGEHEVVDISQCFLMNDNVTRAYKIVKDFVLDNKLNGYDHNAHKGNIRFVVIRSFKEQVLVCLVAKSKIQGLDKLYDELSNAFDKVGLYINYNTNKNAVILSSYFEYIAGIKEIEIEEFGIKYKINMASFLQINNDVKTKIYQKVIDELENEVVIDAYAGAGLLSAVISSKSKYVYSVEIVKEASISAEKLVKENSITNMKVINGDCAKVLPKLLNAIGGEFVAVLDPARVGCDERVLDVVKQAKKIIYISCNPKTLSKDLNTLVETHNIEYVQPYDMFPQTKHLETLVVLKKFN